MCAASARLVPGQNLTIDQIANISERGVLRTLRQRCPFGGGKFSFKAIQQAIDDGSLAFIE